MGYNTVIFDLDGTLLDTLDDLMDSCNYALSTIGAPSRTKAEIRRFVGNGIRTVSYTHLRAPRDFLTNRGCRRLV